MIRSSVRGYGSLAVFVAALSLPSICAAAAGPKVFTETWQDKWHCQRFAGTTGCFVFSGGKFTISFLIPQSSGTGTLPSSFSGQSGTNFDLTLGDYTFQDTIGDFTVGRTGTTATESVSIPKCTPVFRHGTSVGSHCTPFNVEKITLTLAASRHLPALRIVITGTTGEISGVGSSPITSIAAEDLDGSASEKVAEDISLEIDLGSWTFNEGGGSSGSAGTDNVPVTGNVTTKEQKEPGRGTSAATLSNIKIQGTLAP